jgi:hypothetical protein
MDSFKFGNPGSLYFMLERDRFTQAPSHYLKIGIVTGDRDVARREREHQTGNPRQIFSHHSIQTPGVQMLETLMHNHFAKLRVKGEWFKVSESQLDELIDFAEHRATEMGAYLDELEFSANLSDLPAERHHSAVIEDSEVFELSSIRSALLNVHRELVVLRSNKAALAKALIGLRGVKEFPEAIFKVSKREPSEAVSTAKVRKLFPDLVHEFEETKTSWDYSLSFLDAESAESVEVRSIEVEAFEDDPLALHDAYLETWSAIAKSQWDFQIAESQLLFLCGTATELSDKDGTLVSWGQKSRTSFDKSSFTEKYPEEASQCLSQSAGGESVAIAEWRAY